MERSFYGGQKKEKLFTGRLELIEGKLNYMASNCNTLVIIKLI